MVSIDEVTTEITVDSTDFDSKMRGVDSKLDKLDQKARKGARTRGAGVAGAAIGAAAGFIAGAATSNSAVSGVLDLLINVIAAALLPLLVSMLPLIQAISGPLNQLSLSLAPGIQSLAEKTAALIALIPGSDAPRVDTGLGVSVPFRPDAGGQAPEIDPETGRARVDVNLFNDDIDAWLWDKASSAWDWSVRATRSVGGWFS